MLKDLLKEKLTKKQLGFAPSSFDIIGNRDKAVAIIDIPEELKKKEKVVAKAVMSQHKNVKSVLKKASARKGVYRLSELKLVSGSRNTEVIHAESGCRFAVDVKKAYFSPREGTERLRIAGMVRENETVMVFFAGVGAFPVVIAKKSKPSRVIGIEINPDACRYFWKNLKLNRLENVQIVLGDVKEKAAKFSGKCDRVVMPLPETGHEYVSEALKCIKKKGTVHLYAFASEEEISEFSKSVLSAAKKTRKTAKMMPANKVLPYGPGIWKYRLDIEIR